MALKLKGQKIAVDPKAGKILDQNPTQQLERPLRLKYEKQTRARVELNEELISSICNKVNHGLSFEFAATGCGVGLELFKSWLEIGAGTQLRIESSSEPVELGEHAALCYDLFVKLRQCKVGAMEYALVELLSSHDWKAKAWFLEKTGGELFAKRETVKIELGTTAMHQSEYDLDQLPLTERMQLVELFERARVTPKLLSATVEPHGVGSEVVDVEADGE